MIRISTSAWKIGSDHFLFRKDARLDFLKQLGGTFSLHCCHNRGKAFHTMTERRRTVEDAQIIELYFRRDEDAISETAKKYGTFCQRLAGNILTDPADAEECVSDAYFQAWNAIPPQRPARLGAWLGRVVRNNALNCWKKNHRKKRYDGMEQLFSELTDCVPSPTTVERELDGRELTAFLNRWLGTLSRDDRVLFLRRYWNGEAVRDLARQAGVSPAKMAKRMYRLRQDLRAALEKEGYSL
jgi:RNA polymerase sigma-70 factor (ECF subfamily)